MGRKVHSRGPANDFEQYVRGIVRRDLKDNLAFELEAVGVDVRHLLRRRIITWQGLLGIGLKAVTQRLSRQSK